MSSVRVESTGREAKTQRQINKAKRREQLLSAAGRLFADRGFAAVSLDDIGAEVGVTGQAIYRHFSSKQDLLGVLIGQASQSLYDEGQRIEQVYADIFERLHHLIDQQTTFALNSSEIIRVQDRDLAAVEPTKQRDIRRTQRAYIDIWVRALQEVHPRETRDQSVVRAQALLGLINSTGHSFRGLAKRKQTGNFVAHLKNMLPHMALQALLAETVESDVS